MKKIFYTIVSYVFLVTLTDVAYGANINVHPLSIEGVKTLQKEIQDVVHKIPVEYIKAHPSLDDYHFQVTTLYKKAGTHAIDAIGDTYSKEAFGKGELATSFSHYHAQEFYLVYFGYYYLKYVNDKITAVLLNDNSPKMQEVKQKNTQKLEKEKEYANPTDLMKNAVSYRNEARKESAK